MLFIRVFDWYFRSKQKSTLIRAVKHGARQRIAGQRETHEIRQRRRLSQANGRERKINCMRFQSSFQARIFQFEVERWWRINLDCRPTCLTFNRTLFERAFDIKMPQRAMRQIIINKNIYVCSSARVRAPQTDCCAVGVEEKSEKPSLACCHQSWSHFRALISAA